MARPRRPAPAPLEGNETLITAIISAAWVVALVVLAALHSRLPPWGAHWIWTCAVGVGLGLFGLVYVPRVKRSRARAVRGRRPKDGAEPG